MRRSRSRIAWRSAPPLAARPARTRSVSVRMRLRSSIEFSCLHHSPWLAPLPAAIRRGIGAGCRGSGDGLPPIVRSSMLFFPYAAPVALARPVDRVTDRSAANYNRSKLPRSSGKVNETPAESRIRPLYLVPISGAGCCFCRY